MSVASPEAQTGAPRPAASGSYPDDRGVVQKAFWVVAFVTLVLWDTFWIVMRIPLLVLISPVAVPYLLIRRLFWRRR